MTVPVIVDVHKTSLNEHGYKDFKEWNNNPRHLYIGRNMSFYVEGADGSKYRNPFKVSKYGLERSLQLYYDHWKDKDVTELLNYDELGCWCHNREDVPSSLEECKCHGDVLLLILVEQMNRIVEQM